MTNVLIGQTTPTYTAPPEPFIYAVIILVFALLIFGLFLAAQRLQTGTWSLGDALSEEADITVPDANGMPYTVNGNVVKKTVLAASSSRLIAFIGTFGILFLFLGFGAFLLWDFAKTGTIPAAATGDVTKYLLTGLTLFAPYIVNKFSSVFAPPSK